MLSNNQLEMVEVSTPELACAQVQNIPAPAMAAANSEVLGRCVVMQRRQRRQRRQARALNRSSRGWSVGLW